MVRTALASWVLVVWLVACGNGGDDGGGDDAPADDAAVPDAPGPIDAASGAGVACEGMVCPVGEACCFAGPMGAQCLTAATCPGTAYECDQATDCPGQVCCFYGIPGQGNSRGSECTTANACTVPTCATSDDCPARNPVCCDVELGARACREQC